MPDPKNKKNKKDKLAEVEEAMSRAETLWVTAQEKLDTAGHKG